MGKHKINAKSSDIIGDDNTLQFFDLFLEAQCYTMYYFILQQYKHSTILLEIYKKSPSSKNNKTHKSDILS